MFGLGIPEIIIIILAIGIFFFGGKKILEISRSLGRASGEFKKGKQEIEQELKASQEQAANSTEQQPGQMSESANGSSEAPKQQ